jgi:hypothetical protein
VAKVTHLYRFTSLRLYGPADMPGQFLYMCKHWPPMPKFGWTSALVLQLLGNGGDL